MPKIEVPSHQNVHVSQRRLILQLQIVLWRLLQRYGATTLSAEEYGNVPAGASVQSVFEPFSKACRLIARLPSGKDEPCHVCATCMLTQDRRLLCGRKWCWSIFQ